MCTANHFPRNTCGRLLCPEARRGEECNDRCYRESVGYAARCRRCCAVQLAQGTAEEEVKHQVYLGESSRSLPTRLESHIRDYVQDMKKKVKKNREEGDDMRRRRMSDDDDNDEDEAGSTAGVSSWMADHTRDSHNGVMSADPLDDYEFGCTGSFSKPLNRQIYENLRITRAENTGKVKVGRKAWKVGLPLLNRKHEYWAPRTMSFSFSNFNRQ